MELIDAEVLKISTEPCDHKTFIYQLVLPPPFLYEPQCVYQPCAVNELISLVRRHLLLSYLPTPERIIEAKELVRSMYMGPVLQYTPAQVIEHKSQQKKDRYRRAFKSIKDIGERPSEANIRAFVKIEKWNPCQLGVKAPRLIQYRSYEYCAKLSQYMIPIEKELWKFRHNGHLCFSKGMDSWTMARTLRAMWEAVDDPIAVLLDHSKFDSSVSTPWIEVEESFYCRFFYGDDLHRLMSKQKRNRGWTKGGIKYRCEGRKMSGEYNTSLGDSLINYCILASITKHCKQALIFINGDDSVVIISRSQLNKLVLDAFHEYGMKTTIDWAYAFEQIEFCQTRPININGTWRMVRNPKRVISRGVSSVRRYAGEAWKDLVNSIGQCELACNDGVPISQSFADYLIRSASSSKILWNEVGYRASLEGLPHTQKPILDDTRLSMQAAWGISPDEQIAAEKWFANNKSKVLPFEAGENALKAQVSRYYTNDESLAVTYDC